MDRATELNRVLFSHDEDMLAEAVSRQHLGKNFSGVIYLHQEKLVIGQCTNDLELLAKAGSSEDFRNRIYYLPL